MTGNVVTETDLSELVARRRRDNGSIQPDPAKLSDVQAGMVAKLVSPKYAERVAYLRSEETARSEELQSILIEERVREFWSKRGQRYRACSLENFETSHEGQAAVLAGIRRYARDLSENIRLGINILLLGPSGTGKDHLLASMCGPAIQAGLTVQWTSGATLFARVRDAISDDEQERRLLSTYTTPDLLVLSDLTPITGSLTPFQQSVLYSIVDVRYNACRAIWCTINASGRQEVNGAVGAPIVDRLCDGALSFACNWPSFRKART